MPAAGPDRIVVRGAREHNLRDVHLRIPHDAIVVFTGVSGSGKSSLAFDTIHQEGQRRFLESLSAYARQFLGGMERPDVDAVEGLSPTVSIDQKTVNRNPRSTVGTVTEIADHLRLLFARLGQPHCPRCGTPIAALSPGQIAGRLLDAHPGARLLVLAPIVADRKGTYRRELAELLRDGWIRARVDGRMRSLDEPIELARYEKHTIEVVVDRLRCAPEQRSRLVEAIERALEMAGGKVTTLVEPPGGGRADPDGWLHAAWSSHRACPAHPDIAIPELEPRLFSFNAPQGACPTCSGLGELEDFDPDRILDPDRRLPEAVRPLQEVERLPFTAIDAEVVRQVVRAAGGDLRRRLADQPPAVREVLLHGGGPTVRWHTRQDHGRRTERSTHTWTGLLPVLRHTWRFVHHPLLARLRTRATCPACAGRRLNPVALAVTFGGTDIATLGAMRIDELHAFFSSLRLGGNAARIGRELVREIRERLAFLQDVGLGYLALDRPATTLSGGEAQRIRLAAQVGSGLRGVTYVLDEPSIGLHPRDNRRLLRTLAALRDRGNTVLVVEHDAETMLSADWLVDIGPGAGTEGGRVVGSAPPARFARGRSETAAWLRGERHIPLPERRRDPRGWLRFDGATVHNLRDLDVAIPLGVMTAVTGVSGSGKSTLVHEVIRAAVDHALRPHRTAPPPVRRLAGLEAVDKLVVIDQSPIGRTPRSNPATYTGAFDDIRRLFARLPESRARGYEPGRFSFNVPGGRCEDCQGAGVRLVEMQFLADVAVPCEACGGRRYNDETLEIRYRGRTITDVLEMTIAEAAAFFAHHRRIARILGTLVEVGMGYVRLGQPSTTLSGGEAQRVKLATELARPPRGHTLYLLDEPTTGLHFQDVQRLLGALDRLVDAGHSVVVIEHHADVIKRADHLVDLGPEGGDAGGRVVGCGTPEAVARLDTPTGRALAALPEFGGEGSRSGRRRRRRRRSSSDDLVVRGAAAHNLQGVDVSIPRNALAVITGVSGSGKTSLALDTIFAEGQRRYVESLSTYARRFLGRLDRAPVTAIEGLAPAIAIEQKTSAHNPRSTVATVTGIHDLLRLVWARIGHPHCPRCRRPLRAWAPGTAARALAARAAGPGWLGCRLPPASDPAELRGELLEEGFLRLLDEARAAEASLEDRAASEAILAAGCLLVVDRLHPARASTARLAESVANAYRLGAGVVRFVPRDGTGETIVLTRAPTCPEHGAVLPERLTPRHFSFNSHLGACPRCEGLGRVRRVRRERVLPHPERPLMEALAPVVRSFLHTTPRRRALTRAFLARHRVAGLPLTCWPPEVLDALWNGSPEPLDLRWTRRWGGRRQELRERLPWPGLEATIEAWPGTWKGYRVEAACPACKGDRLRPESLSVTVGGLDLATHLRMSVDEAATFWETVELASDEAAIAREPRRELRRRLGFLQAVGLGYLALDRAAATLSGGEAQRIRLASQLGSGLTGCIYVLDEPTIGLHPADTDRLADTLEGLRDLGNTVVVVEHDLRTIRRADHVVDLGPGAGDAGGRVVAQGTPADLARSPASLTGAWLAGRRRMPLPERRRTPVGELVLAGARTHNLRGVTARFALGALNVVTGVSGSGKSSLVMDTLVPAVRARLDPEAPPGPDVVLAGHEPIDRLVVVDQRPIGRTPRSTPATFCGVLDPLRKLFARTPGARERGWSAGRFSYNVPAGRCPACEGNGAILVQMHFLSDVWVPCEACGGRRFARETLEVRWRGRSIADVLDLRATDALDEFRHHAPIARPLRALCEVGLGYLRLGQPATTLSGGEAQRLKLARQLARVPAGALLVLDEPTTGLHPEDVSRLLAVLQALVDRGATAVVIEHDMLVARAADRVIDLGPGGGEAGGRLLACGTPEEVACADTPTGRALDEALREGHSGAIAAEPGVPYGTKAMP